jgi:ABC-type amino acid transport substrate-binding protein
LPDTLAAGMDPTFRPFSFKTADGTIAGFDVDYLIYLTGRTVSVLSDTIKKRFLC